MTKPINPSEAMNDEELDDILINFGKEYEWPYRFIRNKNRSPADQQSEAQAELLDETKQALKQREHSLVQRVLEEVEIVIGKDDVFYIPRTAFQEGYANGRNELRAKVRTALATIKEKHL